MNNKEQFIRHLNRAGDALVLTLKSGAECPCWDWRTPGYNKDYHRTGNPGAAIADCEGTGILTTGETTTTVNLKAVLIPVNNGSVEQLPQLIRMQIGTLKEEALYLIGSIDTDNLEFYDLSSITERNGSFAHDSKKYRLRVIENIYDAGQQGLLVRYE